jgi:hypothetical protein
MFEINEQSIMIMDNEASHNSLHSCVTETSGVCDC